MSDGSKKHPQTKMLWSVSTKTRTYTSVDISHVKDQFEVV